MQAAPELRPLGVGDIVDRVFSIYRERLIPLLAIAAIPYLAFVLVVAGLSLTYSRTFIAFAPLFTASVASRRNVAAAFDFITADLLFQIAQWFALVLLAAMVTTLVQSGALVAATAGRYMGTERTVGGALAAGLRAAPRLMAMGLLAFLAVCALWTLLVIAMAVIAQWWGFAIGLIAGAVLTAFLAASWMISPAVAILERAGPVAALRRAWWLSGGHRWRIIGLVLLLTILQSVLSALLSLLLIASLVADVTAQFALQQAVNLLATIAWAPVYWGTFAVLYYDLRVRKEALDLQLAVEALPRDT